MAKKRFSPEQIIEILREADTSDEEVETFCRRKEISKVSFYRWRAKYGGMDKSEAKVIAAPFVRFERNRC